MLNAGRYTARAVEAALDETSTGKPQVWVLFEVTQGDDAGERISWYGYFTTDGAKQIAIRALRSCGWTGADLMDLSGVDSNEVSLVIEHEPHRDTGEPMARVKWVNAIGAGSARPSRMDEARKRAFAAQMRGEILAFDQKASAGGNGARSAGKQDDPLPF